MSLPIMDNCLQKHIGWGGQLWGTWISPTCVIHPQASDTQIIFSDQNQIAHASTALRNTHCHYYIDILFQWEIKTLLPTFPGPKSRHIFTILSTIITILIYIYSGIAIYTIITTR